MTAYGILPSQAIRALIETGTISASSPIVPGQVQPASLDLRLGARAFRIRASFMPSPMAATREQIERFVLHTIDLTHGAVLETLFGEHAVQVLWPFNCGADFALGGSSKVRDT